MHTVRADRRAEQERELRDELQDAMRRHDVAVARAICQRLDNHYVAQAHVRAADPEVRRLRRLLRQCAE